MRYLIIGLFFLPNILHAQFTIPVSYMGNGGSIISDSRFQICGSLGNVISGEINRDNYNINSGYIPPMLFLVPIEDQSISLPTEYDLEQNYPNPFNPSTIIAYSVPEESYINLKVYDVLGREIVTLDEGEKSIGNYKMKFSPEELASGIYFYRIEARSKISNKHFTQVGKMILVK